MPKPADDEPRLLPPIPLPPAAVTRLQRPVLLTVAAAILAAVSVFAANQKMEPHEASAPVALDTLKPDGTHILALIPSGDTGLAKIAIAALRLGAEDKSRVERELIAGRLSLGVLTLRDWADIDGDVVSIGSAGYRQTVPITGSPTTIVIPYAGPGVATLTAVKDGGGGVTVAVLTASAPMQLRPLITGETINVQIP